MKDFKVGIIGATGMVGKPFGKSPLVSSGGFGSVVPFRRQNLRGCGRFPLGNECSNAGVGEKDGRDGR